MSSSAKTLLLRSFREAWDKAAFVDLTGASHSNGRAMYPGRVFRYADLWRHASALATQWRERGIPSNSVVLVHCEDGVAHPIAHLACLMADLVVCPIPRRTPDAVLQQARQWTEPAIVLGSADPVWAAGADDSVPTEAHFPGDDTLTHGIFFSSGTTGVAKGICLSRNGFFSSAHLYARQAGFGHDTRMLHMLPMGYMAGLVNTLFAVLTSGGTIIHRQEFSPFYVGRMWDDIRRTGVTVLPLFPSIAGIMVQLASKSGFSQLTGPPKLSVHSTSAPLSSKLRKRFRGAFGYGIQNCYGMTELGGPVSLQRPAVNDDSEDAGNLLPGFAPKPGLSDVTPVPLLLRSPHPMLGYLHGPWTAFQPAPSPEFIDTHDLATMDQGLLTLHGRQDDVINKGGIKLCANAVERALRSHVAVEDAAVFGLTDSLRGEVLVACVRTGERHEGLRGELLGHPSVKLALNGLSLDHVLFLPSFPTSHLGKTLRRELRKKATAMLDTPPSTSLRIGA